MQYRKNKIWKLCKDKGFSDLSTFTIPPGFYAFINFPLKYYIKLRFITEAQLKTFARRRWVNISRARGRYYINEICPELIQEYLQIPTKEYKQLPFHI